MESSAYFLGKAEQCLRLAKQVIAKNDPAVEALKVLAKEFETKAIEAGIIENYAFMHPPQHGVVPPDVK